jgi:hypothetical protein
MKKALLAVTLAMVATAALASTPADLALVAVDHPGAPTLRRLLAADLMVVRDMESYLLVAVGSGEFALLDDFGLDWELLDSTTGGKTYYTVGVRSDAELQFFGPGVRILRFDGEEAVIEAEPGEAQKLSDEKLQIARVFFRPIRLAPVVKPIDLGMRIEPDPEPATPRMIAAPRPPATSMISSSRSGSTASTTSSGAASTTTTWWRRFRGRGIQARSW